MEKWEELLTGVRDEFDSYNMKLKLDQLILKTISKSHKVEISKLPNIMADLVETFNKTYNIPNQHIIDCSTRPNNISDREWSLIQTRSTTAILDSQLALVCVKELPYMGLKCETLSELSNDESFSVSYKKFLDQLELVADAYFQQHYSFSEQRVLESFFSSRLDPRQCWNALTWGALDYTSRQLGSPQDILVQIILYNPNEKLLRIKGTNIENDILTQEQIRIDRSITGITLRDLKKGEKYKLYDLTKNDYDRYYIGYLDKRPLSELVVPIMSEGKIVGALNFEHRTNGNFDNRFISEIIHYSTFVSPIVLAILEREKSFYENTVRLSYIYSDMLSRIRGTYTHLLSQPIGHLGSGIAELAYQAKRITDPDIANGINAAIEIIDKCFREVSEKSNDYLTEVPGYIEKTKVSVKHALQSRLHHLIRYADSEKIQVTINCDDDVFVYTSRFLQEHIFNIINNAFQAVSDRIKRDEISEGKIRIDVRKVDVLDSLSRGIEMRNVLICIDDNGGGLSEEFLKKFGKEKFTTKGVSGNGIGVVAAKDYFALMSGRFGNENLFSEDGKRLGLRVLIELPEFDTALHNISDI